MGKYAGKRRTLKRDFKEKRENVWADKRQKNDDGSFVNRHEMRNEAFEEYYKAQGVVPEAEWEEFMSILRTPLPTTFRINGTGKFAHELLERLQEDFFGDFHDEPILLDGEKLEPPRPLPWYPEKLAWQMNFSRSQLRKLPMLAKIHEFMKRENEAGSITRQEAVSMVPPLFLDVQPQHRVLDMCAAPGSKTFQLLEMLHAGESGPPTGLVVANDADAQRCNLLTHQTKRMCSPCLLVTNHEAQKFPLIFPHPPVAGEKKTRRPAGYEWDRILCDVPCSGDGTIRKAPDIWRRWSPQNGNGLHLLQLKITLQACRILKVGGRLVYSTCTPNPIEDEAVVAEVLRRCGGAMELVEVGDVLPNLKRHAGKKTWKVKDKTQWYDSFQAAQEAGAFKIEPSMFPPPADECPPLERCMRFLPHMQDTGGFFVCVLKKVGPCATVKDPAPASMRKHEEAKKKAQSAAKEAESAAADVEAAGDDDLVAAAAAAARLATAASEVAAAAATIAEATTSEPEAPAAAEPPAEAPSEPAPSASETTAADSEPVKLEWGVRGGGGRGRDGGGRYRGLDPIIPIQDKDLLDSIVEFYGISSEFPLRDQLITRSPDKPKRLYFVSTAVKTILCHDRQESMKVTATGLKAFERQEVRDGSVPCHYRIAQEGLPFLLPYVTKQRLTLGKDDFVAIIRERCVGISGTDHPADPANAGKPKPEPKEGEEVKEIKVVNHFISDKRTLEALGKVAAGCTVCTLRDEDARSLGLTTGDQADGALAASAPLAISCWRGGKTINVLVSKPECAQMVEKIKQAEERVAKHARAKTEAES